MPGTFCMQDLLASEWGVVKGSEEFDRRLEDLHKRADSMPKAQLVPLGPACSTCGDNSYACLCNDETQEHADTLSSIFEAKRHPHEDTLIFEDSSLRAYYTNFENICAAIVTAETSIWLDFMLQYTDSEDVTYPAKHTIASAISEDLRFLVMEALAYLSPLRGYRNLRDTKEQRQTHKAHHFVVPSLKSSHQAVETHRWIRDTFKDDPSLCARLLDALLTKTKGVA